MRPRSSSSLKPPETGPPLTRLPRGIRGITGQALGSISLRVRSGPNAGLRWSLVSAGRGYLAGTFEADRVTALLAFTRPGDHVWDIGAHKGYLSLAFSRAAGPSGKVLAFEPSHANRSMLEKHIRWNDARTVQPFEFALSDSDGQQQFGGSGSSITFRLGRGDDIVKTRTIDSLVSRDGHRPPDVLKIDAEGSEAAILRGGLAHLSPHMLIWISIHTRALYDECCEILGGLGFSLHPSARLAERAQRSGGGWGGDAELLAAGSQRAITEADLRALKLFHPSG